MENKKYSNLIVNLLSDYILSKIPSEESTIINVVDCENFFVVKGKTSYSEILKLNDIVDEFSKKHEDILDKKITHTIDLIDYDVKIEPLTELKITFYKNENCFVKPEKFEIDSNQISLINSSVFPYGYSLNQGRLFYYYGKKIFYSIPETYPTGTLTFLVTNQKEQDGEIRFEVFNEFNQTLDGKLKSVILDLYDFDMTELKEKLKKVDLSSELINPLFDFDFLKEKNKDFIII